MAAGLSIAATDIPSIRHAVGEDGYPFVSPVGDAAELADRIVTLSVDGDLRNRAGGANRTRATNHFSLSQCFSRTATVISKELKE